MRIIFLKVTEELLCFVYAILHTYILESNLLNYLFGNLTVWLLHNSAADSDSDWSAGEGQEETHSSSISSKVKKRRSKKGKQKSRQTRTR